MREAATVWRCIGVMAFAILPASTWAEEWESLVKPSIYCAVFTNYVDGTELSDMGAEGGGWGDWKAYAADAEAFAREEGGRTYMSCSTLSDGLRFTPADVGKNGPKAVLLALRVAACGVLPELPAEDKAAFAVYAPEGAEPTFQGWSAQGWQALHAPGIVPSDDRWYEVSVWISANIDNVIQVQYRLKSGKDFVPLRTAAGADWIRAGAQGDAIVRGIEFRGNVAFERMSGRELPLMGIVVIFR